MLQLLIDEVEGYLKRQIKNRTFWVVRWKKKWSVISRLFPLNSILLYISNWSKVLEFYFMSFFNMKSLSVYKIWKFSRQLSGPLCSFIHKRTINKNYMTLLMALHHTHDGCWYFFRCYKSNSHSLHTSNFESVNKKPFFIRYLPFSWSNSSFKLS